MSDEDSRYKSLIQPIKDLASNWDIDIAESLTDYLDELDGLRVSLDGGVNSLNFAEAALLIQGSTAIYSKKVEYLHQLVLQSLEYITNKKSAVIVNSKTKTSTQSTFNDESILFGNDPDLLLLDDDVEVGTNINLKLTAGSSVRDRNSKSRNSSGRFSSSSGLDVSRISISLMHSVLHDDHGSSSLKLSSCLMDPSGALLIGGIQPSSADSNNLSRANKSFFNQSISAFVDKPHDRTVGFLDQGNDDQYADDYGGGMDADNDNDYWGVSDPIDEPANIVTDIKSESKPVQLRQQSTVSTRGSSDTISIRPDSCFSRHQLLREVKDTSFEMLDPHQLAPGSKAIGKGKTYRLPSTLVARRAGNEVEDESEETWKNLIHKDLDDFKELKKRINNLSLGKHPPKQGLFNPTLAPLLKSVRKAARREKQQRNKVTKATTTESANFDYAPYERLWSRDLDRKPLEDDAEVVDIEGRLQLAAGIPEYEILGGFASTEGGVGGGGSDTYGGYDDYNGGAAGGDYYDDNDNDYGGGGGGAEGGGDGVSGYSDRPDAERESEEAELARRLERVLNEDFNHANSYQAICEKHIRNFHSGAEQYARETQLSRRVSDWTKRLEPILRAQEDAPQFDIHEYSDAILVDIGIVSQQLDEANEQQPDAAHPYDWITFDEIAKGRSSTEVCRMFLACLQLANLGNIEFEEVIPTKSHQNDAKKSSNKKKDDSSRKRSSSKDALGLENLFHIRLVKENRYKSIENFSTTSH